MNPSGIASYGSKRFGPSSKASFRVFQLFLTGFYAVLTLAAPACAQKIPPGNDPGNNNPPPAGAILDLAPTPVPGGGNSTYQMYSVGFTASLANTAITFAFREDPAFLYFSNVAVNDTAGGGNLLVNGNFAGATYTDNGNVATPVGWEYANVYGATFGGVVLPNCGVGPGGALGTSNCWYDGAVQAYDALTQTIATIPGHNYQITFWLADNSGCEIDGGPPCYFSDLSTNGDVTDTGGNGIDLTVYVGAALPAPDALRLELGTDSVTPNQPMLALASAMQTSGSSATMLDAAQKMGFDHFNWVQFIHTDLDLQACGMNMLLPGCASDATMTGSVPPVPTQDAPPGGYAYQSSVCNGTTYPLTPGCLASFPVRDFWPMYWDEYFAPPSPGAQYWVANPSSPMYTTQYRTSNQLSQFGASSGINPGQAYGFSFSDMPNTTFNVSGTSSTRESINFVTALVGITGTCNTLATSGNCAFQIFPGTTFAWSSTNGAVTFTPTPGSTPNFTTASLNSPAETAGSLQGGKEQPDYFPVNPTDLTGSQLANSIISTDEFLQLAGLTPQSLASIGGGVSIFSGSLIASEAAALAAAQSGTPPTYDNQVQVFAMPNTYTYSGSTVVTVKLLPGMNPTHAPTGTVHLMLDGDTLPATLILSGSGHGYAAAYYDLTEVSAGSHLLAASYSGDANNPAGVSQPIPLQVAPAPVKLAVSCQNATLLYTASYKCEVYTQPINAGSNTSITYQFDSAAPVTVPLNGGTATFTIPTPSMGPHTVVISYAAQGNYAPATSQTENFTVIPH